MTVIAVIFDMDGLMFDTERLARNAWRRAMAERGYALDDEVYRTAVGRTVEGACRAFVEAFGPELPIADIEAAKARYLSEMLEPGPPLKPGLLSLLDGLDALRLPLAVASSTARLEVERRLASVSLLRRFSVIVGGDEVAHGKPAPDIFLLAAERLGASPAGCLVLEDSEAGVLAAAAAGMAVVVVPDLVDLSPSARALARAVLGSLAEALEVVARVETVPSSSDMQRQPPRAAGDVTRSVERATHRRTFMPDPRRIVEEGYDRIAERHSAWAGVVRAEERSRYTDRLLRALPEGADVLDLGCGAGGPTCRTLASRFHLTGVDISARSVALARADLPQAHFIHADMTKIDFPPCSFDGVVAFYSIIHIPREEHAALLARVADWLRPGGLFVAAFGTRDTEAEYDPDWLGAPMYWSGYPEATGRLLIEAAGFTIEEACVEVAQEDGQPVPFLWVVSRRDAAAGPVR